MNGAKDYFNCRLKSGGNHSLTSTNELKNYKQIFNGTNGHRENHDPSGVIKTTRGINFHDFVSKLIPGTRKRGVESALRRQWITY